MSWKVKNVLKGVECSESGAFKRGSLEKWWPRKVVAWRVVAWRNGGPKNSGLENGSLEWPEK